MATLANGSFVFIGEHQQLNILEKGTHQKPYVIYGTKVCAFAFNGAGDIIALALPAESESGGAHASAQRGRVVRLYRFSDDELGEMIGEISSNLTFSQLLWVGSLYLVACGSAGSVIYTWKNERLVHFVKDQAVAGYLQGGRLALFQKERKRIEFWDLDKNCILDEIMLSPRKGHSEHQLIAVTGDNCFTFALYDNGTVEVFYVTRSRSKKVATLTGLLPSESYPAGAHELVACALSSRKVLLGRRGDTRVLKLEYRNESAVVVGMQEELSIPLTLVRISTDGRRCLTFNTELCEYRSTVLNFSASRPNDAVSTNEAATSKGARSALSKKGNGAAARNDLGEQVGLEETPSNGSASKKDGLLQPVPEVPKSSPVVQAKKSNTTKDNVKEDKKEFVSVVVGGTLVTSLLIIGYAIRRLV